MKRFTGFLVTCILLAMPLVSQATTNITTRAGAGRSLTWSEMDGNFSNLRNAVDSNAASEGASIAALQAAQASGSIGFTSYSTMTASLNYNAGTTAILAGDSTPANDGTYVKTGASGSGSWVKSAFVGPAWINANLYSSLASAVSAQGSSVKHLVISAPMTLTADMTSPSTLSIEIINGGSINTNGFNLTINGPFKAGSNQVFTGAGSVVFGPGSLANGVMGDWFGVLPGTSDVSARAQIALTSAVLSQARLRLSAGVFTFLSQIITGNTTNTVHKRVEISGTGMNNTFIVGNIADGIIKIAGPSPELDGGENRHDGRVYISDLTIGASPLVAGKGLHFYGVQGISLERVQVHYLGTGIYFHNVDLVTINDCWLRLNTTGIGSSGTGYAASGGQLNSFNVINSRVSNNSGRGIDYVGGISPNFIGVNFGTQNGIALALSYTAESNHSTINPQVIGCYFENDSTYSIYLGGTNGTVRGGLLSGNTFLIGSTATGVFKGNVSSVQIPRLEHNNYTGSGGNTTFVAVDTTTIGDGVVLDSIADTELGYTRATGNTRHGRRLTTTKFASTGASVDFISVGSWGAVSMGKLFIRAYGTGTSSAATFEYLVVGGSAPATWTATKSAISGTGSWTVTESTNSGTNTLTLNNTSSIGLTFEVVVLEEYDLTSTIVIP